MTLQLERRRNVARQSLRLLPRLSSPLATILVAASVIPMALGHEHHEDAIPTGETVSADPIVRFGWQHCLAWEGLFDLELERI